MIISVNSDLKYVIIYFKGALYRSTVTGAEETCLVSEDGQFLDPMYANKTCFDTLPSGTRIYIDPIKDLSPKKYTEQYVSNNQIIKHSYIITW